MRAHIARALATEWGSRGGEALALRTQLGSPAGQAYAARLERLPPAEAASEIMAAFALDASPDLAREIADDLQIDPVRAGEIAAHLVAARRRLERATRPFRPIGADEG